MVIKMDAGKWQTIYLCFIAGGLTIPIFDLLVGSLGNVISGAGHVDADADVDMDADADVDVDADVSADVPAGVGHRGRTGRRVIVNLMTVSFAATVFGALGWFFNHHLPPLLTLAVALAAGVAAGYFLGHFILLPLKRSRPLANGIRSVKGMDGRVKLELRSDFVGTITVLSATGSVVTYNAMPMPGIDLIKVGTQVRVIQVDASKQICTVIPLE